MKTTDARSARRWQNLMLNRRFQLKYMGLALGISMVISAVLGLILIEQIQENSRLLQLDEVDSLFAEQLAQADLKSVGALLAALLVFNISVGLGALFLTHRMAGPIYVFNRYLVELSQGRIPRIRAQRKGDEFAELHRSWMDAADSMRSQARREAEVLEKVLQSLRAQGGLAEAEKPLENLLQSKRASCDESVSTDP